MGKGHTGKLHQSNIITHQLKSLKKKKGEKVLNQRSGWADCLAKTEGIESGFCLKTPKKKMYGNSFGQNVTIHFVTTTG